MVELSAEEFAQRAFDFDLVTERQLNEVWREVGGRQLSGDEFRQLLLRRDLLTNYQAERLIRGERTGFFYGDYKVLYLVGTGTFARVYRAAHKTSGKIVAVKVLRKKFSNDAAQAQSFCREGQVVATLRHSNIVSVFEVYSKGDVHFLVMDFIEGRNLRDFVKVRKKFDPAEATRLVTDVANGLSYAFLRGIHHRDLKMSNILVSSRGEAKLVDFGLAAADANESEDLEEVTNPRTIDYAGLERATGVGKDDPRSDIYFLGCIYYHLLTGIPPLYETKDRIQRLSKTRFENVRPILEIDPALPRYIAPAVNKAMQLNPALRYQSPAEMLSDLKLAAQRLGEPENPPAVDALPPVDARLVEPSRAAQQRVLMFIESNPELQNIFRQKLKTSGYRVLVTQDPERALSRFADDPKAADCAIFSTGVIGEAALDAFNQFGTDKTTQDLPAILLLGEEQGAWKARANLNDRHIAVSMPIKLREFRQLLATLVPIEAVGQQQ